MMAKIGVVLVFLATIPMTLLMIWDQPEILLYGGIAGLAVAAFVWHARWA